MLFDRLKRITDLFTEGREAELGMDEHGEPVLIWVNKLNSFEEEESRRDGHAARTDRLLELKEGDNADTLNARSELQAWTLEELKKARVNQKHDEDFISALNDIEADKDWSEKVDYLRRNLTLLNDADVPADDPRRARYTEVNDEYMRDIAARITKLQAERLQDLANVDRQELEDAYMAEFREREAFNAFIAEKRVTELFFAIRDCQAFRRGEVWDHSKCDHRRRLLNTRSDVRSLPQGVIDTVINMLDNMLATPRESGNSAAPESSSASSEQPNAEADSTPSTPAATPTGVQQT